MPLVYLDEMQEPDVLERDGTETLQDVTAHTEKAVHILPNVPTRIYVIWAYCYYRIPITRVSMEPECISRDLEVAPLPEVSDVDTVVDPGTGKAIGVAFTVKASRVDSWIVNLQVECTYHNAAMGRTYTHRRSAYFWVATQRDITEVLEQVTGD